VPVIETRRSIGTHKSTQNFKSGGYTFYFSSHVDTSHSTSFINSHAREWGVCIAVRTGLAYESVESHLAKFDARLQHGIVRVPTPKGDLVSIDILGAYAPARHEHKQAFWEKLNTYVQSLAPQYLTSTDKHLILAGDWNSYIDTERDIYRLDPSDTTLLTTSSSNQHLQTFLDDLQEAELLLFDPMARDKLTAFNDFTFLSSNQKYRSIPDKLFTSFPTYHCDPSRILEWEDAKALGLSDHRPVLTKISLASLCSGWIEYPLSPITRPRITINADNITQEQNDKVIAAVSTWKSTLPPHIAAVLLHDPAPNLTAEVSINDLTSIHSHLTDLFVTIPGQCYTTGPQTQQKVYKPLKADKCQHVLSWLQHYKLMLATLYAAKVRGARSLSQGPRRNVRQIRQRFLTDTSIQEALPEISHLFSINLSKWSLASLDQHRKLTQTLHTEWKKPCSSMMLFCKANETNKKLTGHWCTATQ
jgi:exonuclease III